MLVTIVYEENKGMDTFAYYSLTCLEKKRLVLSCSNNARIKTKKLHHCTV